MKEFWIHDTSFHLWLDQVTPECRRDFDLLLKFVARIGFQVYPCERTAKNYPCLAKDHMRAHYAQLKSKLTLGGRHISVEFYQEEVTVNPNGGEYDFSKFSKMPYVIGLRFRWTKKLITDFLLSLGFAKRSEERDVGWSDPLKRFNAGWGADRFKRGADGWPDASEVGRWGQNTGDGVPLKSGDVAYCQVRGRWLRCKVFGGINGMWQCLNGESYLDTCSAHRILSRFIGRGRIYRRDDWLRIMQKAMDAAVKRQDFLAAHAIKLAVERLEKSMLNAAEKNA